METIKELEAELKYAWGIEETIAIWRKNTLLDVIKLIDEIGFEFDINEGDDEGMCLVIKDGVLDKPKPIKLIKAEELKARINGK